MTSETLINLTKSGLGRELPEENFPNLKQSLMDCGSIDLLMLESTLTALLRSDSKRCSQGVSKGGEVGEAEVVDESDKHNGALSEGIVC